MSVLLRSQSQSVLPADPEFNALVCQVAEELESGRPVDLAALRAQRPEHAARLERLLPTLEAMAALGQSAAKSPASGFDLNEKDDREGIAGVLGEFRIIREIGRGGMGVVYEAEQIPLSRRVALKVLPLASMLSDVQLKRFKNEVRAAAALKHPNIVSIHSVGCDRGVHYYAMELVEGQSLAELLQQLRSSSGINVGSACAGKPGVLPPSDTTRDLRAAISTHPSADSLDYFGAVARLGADAAEALEHAHEQGVLHRDVKPANLLLDHAGKLWVADFGLARVEADAGLTMTGDLVGTLRYMSPEQVLAQGVVDHRTDVYSLGVTLYELATLEPAFHHASRSRLIHDIVFERVRPPRHVNPQIPRDLDTIICKATEREPSDRYASAKDLAHDLRQFANSQPITARSGGPLARLSRWSTPRRPWVVATAVLAAMLTVVCASIIVFVRDVDGNEKARLRVDGDDRVEIVQTPAADQRGVQTGSTGPQIPSEAKAANIATPPPTGPTNQLDNNQQPRDQTHSSAGRQVPTPDPADEVVQRVRPIRSANPQIGDQSLALYFAYGPVDGGSTLVQANWDGTVRGYIELPYSISGLAEDKGRLLATIGSSRVGQGRVVSIDQRGVSQTVFRDKKLLPDTTEIWSSSDSDEFLVADNGADLVAAIRKDGARPPEVKVKLPHTANYQSMSVAMSDDGSVLFSDSDQNGVFRLPPGSGPTLGAPLLNESGAVADRPGTTIWAAALEDKLHIFDRDQQLAEMAYPVGMTMLRPIIACTKDGALVLGFYAGNRQYFYAVDMEAKKFYPLFTVDVDRLTALALAPKIDWTEGDAVQLQSQSGKQPPDSRAEVRSSQPAPADEAGAANGGFRLSFDGKDDFVKIPSLKYDGSTPISIELRATPASRASYRQLVLVSNFAYRDNQDYGISLFQRGDTHPRPTYASWAIAYAGQNQSSHSLIAPADAWEVGRATHIALVAGGRRYRFYLDGKLWKRGELGDDPAPSDQSFTIGGHEMLKGFYHGTIDEVRISKAVRYTADFTPARRFEPDAKTLALYHCDEGRGDILKDASGNGHDGKIIGATWVGDE